MEVGDDDVASVVATRSVIDVVPESAPDWHPSVNATTHVRHAVPRRWMIMNVVRRRRPCGSRTLGATPGEHQTAEPGDAELVRGGTNVRAGEEDKRIGRVDRVAE